MTGKKNWLDPSVTIQGPDGVNLPMRSTVRFTGVTPTDDPDNDRTEIPGDAGGGAGDLANAGTGGLDNVVSTIGGVAAAAVRFSGVAPAVHGFTAGAAARKLVVFATGGPLVLANENAGSDPGNRILTGTGSDVTIANGGCALLVYDETSSRWRIAGDALPAGSTNAVLQRSGTGAAFFAALTLDQIAAAYSVALALTGAALVEAGQTVATPAFTASYARTPAAAVLTDTVPTTPQDVIGTPTAFSSTGSFTLGYGASVTFTLTANETGGPSKTSSASITWGQKEFWGNAVPGTPNAAFIAALPSSALATARARTFTSTAGATERLYYAFRSAYGTPTFTVGGFVGGFHLAASAVAVTNAHGVTENYDIWESDNLNLGATTVVVS